MAAHTSLLDFRMDSTIIRSPTELHLIQQEVESILKLLGFKKQFISADFGSDCGCLALFVGDKGSHATVCMYEDGLVTMTLEEYVFNGQLPILTPEVVKDTEAKIKKALNTKKSKGLPALKRGATIDQYLMTSDDRVLEYDFDQLLFEADTPYQNIKILHSSQFGNVLLLDDLQNLADSDLIYTQTLMRYGKESYTGKTVFILGGGDGGLLHEILKEKPNYLYMVDIDEMVLQAAKKFLRNICGNCLDTLKGENYEVIVGDCVPVMEKFIEEGKTFDYVINDLTDIPITPTPQGEFWDFIRRLNGLAMELLKPTGKFLAQGNGVNSQKALAMYEEQLGKLSCSVAFRKHMALVPSFLENWIFYEIWKTE